MWTILVLALVSLGGQVSRGAITCDPRYSTPTNGSHTMCLDSSSHLLTSGITNAQKTEIVDRHNHWRRSIPSTNMVEMTWDDEIAAIAQKWSDNCQFQHDDRYNRYNFGKNSVGQNIASSSSHHSWTWAVDDWADEVNNFQYNGSASDQTGKVGHYTQVMWATTYKVGCGYTHCSGRPNHFYVCNYSPAGNNVRHKYVPYTEGDACHDCPDNCNNGLCDCGGKVCNNGGTMDLKTCTCSCQHLHFYDGSDTCEMDCASGTDERHCGSFYHKTECTKYSNLPYICPTMCEICPAYNGTSTRR